MAHIKSEIISVDGNNFNMILVNEYDGYCFVNRSYDLFYKNKLIGKDIGSIKACYYKAYLYTQKKLTNVP